MHLPAFLTSALDGSAQSASYFDHFMPGRRQTEWLVCRILGVHAVKREKPVTPVGNRTPAQRLEGRSRSYVGHPFYLFVHGMQSDCRVHPACHWVGTGSVLAREQECTGTIPGQSVLDLWWTKWHWDRFFS
jgi:hypothetical protein